MSDYSSSPRSAGEYESARMSTAEDEARTAFINTVSWGAIFAGVILALVTQLILNMLGIGIGAASVGPATGDNPSASTISIGAAVWFAISGIIAALVGGYTAGRLCGRPNETAAEWHGVATWALSTLIVFALLSTAVGGVIGGAYRAIAGSMSSVASVVGSTAPNLVREADPFSSIEQSLRTSLGGEDPAALRDAAIAAMRAAVSGNQQDLQANREQAAQILARALKISADDARARVSQYEQQYRDVVDRARQTAVQAADTTAKAVSRGALLGAIGLLLGALASWIGGRMGCIDPTLPAMSRRWPGGGRVRRA